ncbi:MAG: formate dehydrogenase family accessory protein FdhD [Hyphomicrobiales bacterium]|nr:MAG: formate dehydrogenase family accessory protein FdhD [Hyphomicrobiales bacterium]
MSEDESVALEEFTIAPNPDDPLLSSPVSGVDHTGQPVEIRVVNERALTLFLNSQEIVTMMTIGDHPDLLAIGYLLNQNMLKADDVIRSVDYEEDIGVIVVRTERQTNYEEKLKKKVRTSGCAQGTVFGDVMDSFGNIKLASEAKLHTSWLYSLSAKINTQPSLYLSAGAIHGCVLCKDDRPLVYMEDVGRHNAVDKIAGWMFRNGVSPDDKIFYTTGRLTSEMVIKTVLMGIPVLASRSGFTAAGVELARKAGLTLVGRLRGKRFVAVAGTERIIFDEDPERIGEEDPKHARKGGRGHSAEA